MIWYMIARLSCYCNVVIKILQGSADTQTLLDMLISYGVYVREVMKVGWQ